MLPSRDRSRRWRLLANLERTTERLRRDRESHRRRRQSNLSTHDQIESSSSSRNRQRRSRLLQSLERREDRLRRNSQSMKSRRSRSTQSDLLIHDQIDSMSSTNFLSTHANEQTANVHIDVNKTKLIF